MSAVRPEERKTLSGVVVSDKMAKTRVVEIRGHKRHSVYQKVRNTTTKIYAHDEANKTKIGDRVVVMETRPMSKLKRWRIAEILK